MTLIDFAIGKILSINNYNNYIIVKKNVFKLEKDFFRLISKNCTFVCINLENVESYCGL